MPHKNTNSHIYNCKHFSNKTDRMWENFTFLINFVVWELGEMDDVIAFFIK